MSSRINRSGNRTGLLLSALVLVFSLIPVAGAEEFATASNAGQAGLSGDDKVDPELQRQLDSEGSVELLVRVSGESPI